MKNTVIKGDGTSRKIKAPSDIPTTFGDWRAQLLAGSATLDIALNADGCETVGTPLSKENLLSDTTKTALGLISEDPTINEALAGVKTALDGKAPQVLSGEGAPNNQTVGVAGQLYVDTDTYDVYVCRRIYNGLSTPIYIWGKVIVKANKYGEVGTPSLRNEYFVAKASYVETGDNSNAPTVEGQICWLYG